MFAQTDAGTMVGLGSVCVTLLGLLGWVLREMVNQNRDATTFIKANTEVLVALKSESETGMERTGELLTRVQDLKAMLDSRPCALIHSPDVVEWLQKSRALDAKG